MKARLIINRVVNYLAAIGLALVFALFLSGRIGWFLLAAFLSAPLISLLLTMLFVKRIYVSSEVTAPVIAKGDCCEVTITLSSGVFLPSPPIVIEISDCPTAVCSDKRIIASVMPFSDESVSISYKARICGPCSVGASSVKITDYFGIFSFSPQNADPADLVCEIAVIPDIAQISPRDEAVKTAVRFSLEADDSEDTSDIASATFTGFPGYESREYIPGDPLKRINWKQSAKRGRLLVRLDDEALSSSITVVLDSSFFYKDMFIPAILAQERFAGCTEYDIVPFMAEFAAEGALGMIKTFLDMKYSVGFIMMGENGWQSYPVTDESDIALIRTELASYRFDAEGNKERFPAELLAESGGSVSVFCTPFLDNRLSAQLAGYTGSAPSKGGLQTVIYSAAASLSEASAQGGHAR